MRTYGNCKDKSSLVNLGYYKQNILAYVDTKNNRDISHGSESNRVQDEGVSIFYSLMGLFFSLLVLFTKFLHD